ncbi:MAG: DNA gyrase inhibitor YacG [Nitrospirae bacterium]|nr:DNA gyrase inhibitor YacG [Nitrospirota bacterium]
MMVRCPRCAKEVSYAGNPYRPFCCERCKTADLAAWADEQYKIPQDKADEISYHNNINMEETEC